METAVVLYLLLLLRSAEVTESTEAERVNKEVGEDCELPCRGPDHAAVLVLEWFKADQQLQRYLHLYRGGKELSKYQDESFQNRVQLRDHELKTGDLTVVLKSVVLEDSGKYECKAVFETSGGKVEISQEFDLTVTSPPVRAAQSNKNEGETMAGATAGSLGLVGIAAVAVALINRKRETIKNLTCLNTEPPSPSQEPLSPNIV